MSRVILTKFKTGLPMNVILYPTLHKETHAILFQNNYNDKSNMNQTAIMRLDGSIMGYKGELKEEDIKILQEWVYRNKLSLANYFLNRINLRIFWKQVFNEDLPPKPHKKKPKKTIKNSKPKKVLTKN